MCVLSARLRGGIAGFGFSSVWLSGPRMVSVPGVSVLERKKGIWWMPWHQEAMKDVARCEKPRGAASRR